MNINIGKRIAYFRTTKGLTVNKLANLSGISQSYLRDIELGKNCNPSVDILDCLCTTLGITLQEFFDTEDSVSFANDPLMLEIYKLSPHQKEKLLTFLHSLHD